MYTAVNLNGHDEFCCWITAACCKLSMACLGKLLEGPRPGEPSIHSKTVEGVLSCSRWLAGHTGGSASENQLKQHCTWSSETSSSMPLHLPFWLFLGTTLGLALGVSAAAKTRLPLQTCRSGECLQMTTMTMWIICMRADGHRGHKPPI